MISVRNHRPLLSGSKWLIFLCIGLIIGACSPKVRPTSQPEPVAVEKPVEPKPVEKPVIKTPQAAVISLLLPFGLDHLNPGSTYSLTTLKQAEMALDYYQGFELGLDSLTAKGFNFKLQLFDTKGTTAEAHELAYKLPIRSSDLIVGPVFTDDLKAFASVLTAARKPILSPLSPADPSKFKNQNLITIIPPLESHAWAAAQYVAKTFRPKRIFILRSGFSDEIGYTVPFKHAIDSLGKKHIAISQLTVVHGNLSSLQPLLSPTDQNIFVIPATDQSFLTVTLRMLDSLGKIYPVTVIGHPNWQKLAFLKPQLLSRLNTYITCSDKVNYNAEQTLSFLKAYHKAYHSDASDYAIKGFDEGMYFGGLLGANPNGLRNLNSDNFTGIHNTFQFTRKPGLGWVNTHVNIYHYVNFDLKQVE
jgi:hypothetical protein